MHKKRAGSPIGMSAMRIPGAIYLFVKAVPAFALIVSLSNSCINDHSGYRDRTAIIYEKDGKKGAAGVMVRLFDFGSTDNKPAGSAITDDHGRYSIADIPYGIYSLWAEQDTLVLFQDSVVIASSHTNLRDDTLEYPSSMIGIVSLQPYHDPRTVTIHVIGTGKRCNVADETGWFTLEGLAGGDNLLRLESTLPEYIPTTRTVFVAARPYDTLMDTLSLFYTGIPVVAGIRISQDTLAGTVTLAWKKTDHANVKDYLLYKDTGSGDVVSEEPFAATADTFFIDSLKYPRTVSTSDTAVRSLNYRVAIRDKMEQVGPTWQHIAITFAPVASVATFFSHHVRYAEKGGDSASTGDTIMLIVAARNPTRSLRSLAWYDPEGDTIARMFAADTAAKELADTLQHVFASAGVHRILVAVTDNGGRVWSDTVAVHIVTDVPVANAGGDTGVFAGDTVRLRGSATQRFGTIVGWRWKIGSGEWTTTKGPDTFTIAPAVNEMMVCSLAVIDDDGNRDVDVINVTVFSRIQRIAASGDHSLFLTTEGTLWACGSNTYGQLGDGATTNRSFPVKVMNDVLNMSAGSSYTLILKTDSTLWACGNNDFGELGDGTTEHRLTPVRIMADVKSMAAGYCRTFIVKTDGTLWICGHDCCGPEGDSVLHDYLSPVQVKSGVECAAAGKYHSLILKTDGTLWSFGYNHFGQLGDGSTEDRSSPVQVMDAVRSIAAGEFHSLIIKTDGTLRACGWNEYGQLGDNTTEDRRSPVRIMNEALSVAAGHGHSLIVATNGTLRACGNNAFGQLGDSTTTDRSVPVNVMSGVKEAAAGYGHNLILRNDGSLWVCGENTYGELGDGTRENRSTPLRMYPPLYNESK